LQSCVALAVALYSIACPESASWALAQETSSVAEQAVEDAPAVTADARPVHTYMGRQIAPPMHFSGAGWLTRQSRVKEENPARLLEVLELKPGQVVCDFGCGNGYHTLQLAKRVGPNGLVYAVDIQPEMLTLLAERAQPRGLENIRPVLATEEDSGMPPETFDLVLMVDVYHELSHPPEVLAAVRASLKPHGRLAVVEFREEDPKVEIRPLHKMSQVQVMKEIPLNGFKLVGQFNELPSQHVFQFARDDSPLPKVDLQLWNSAK
jgi:ubiquinone/menaquinone biosynthesis C-methylase UbiE